MPKGFNAVNFLNDHDIPFWEEGKNVTPGWVNICCPLPDCTDTSNHGGFNPEKGYYNCWKCGWHPVEKVIEALLNCTIATAERIKRNYQMDSNGNMPTDKKFVPAESIQPPYGADDLQGRHKAYLDRRGFDPKYLARKYHLMGTNHLGDYKFRIIAPIFLNGKMVSYQGRDITDKAELRYKACPIEKEIVHHKHILYNIDNCNSDRIVIVEGITDVWRLGDGSACTFGTRTTQEQVNFLLSRDFKRIYILFDSEAEAQLHAKNLAWKLQASNCKTELIELSEGDPGELSDTDAKKLMEDLL